MLIKKGMALMRIKQLEYLEAVIETGSINEAAKRLYLTQPSLSSAIKDLEKEMGITICNGAIPASG